MCTKGWCFSSETCLGNTLQRETRGTVVTLVQLDCFSEVKQSYVSPSFGPQILLLTKIIYLNLTCKIHTPVTYPEASRITK